jgi:lysophospholipase L1-like esterase
MINRAKNKIPEQFKIFYPFLREHFYKNYDQILQFVESKKDLVDIYLVQIYSMQTPVNYNKLKDKLIETKAILDLECDEKEKEKEDNK